MSMAYIVDKDRKLVLSTARGILSYHDAFECLDRLERDPDFSPSFGHLCDYTRVVAFALSGDEIELLTTRRVFSTTSRWAFVASSQLACGLARAFESYLGIAGFQQARVLDNKEEALRWLTNEAMADAGPTNLP